MDPTTPTAVSFETYGGTAPENYQRYFVPAIAAPLARELVATADIRAGERVVDVACGTGVVARLAAERTGDGDVVGVDPNPGMLEVARASTPDDLRIEWLQAPAEDLPLPDGSFDVALCQMGLQFVADKVAALAEIGRVLGRDGRLVLNAPGPTPPPFVALAEALGRHLRPELAGFVHAVFSLHDPTELEVLLRAAGFRDVAVEHEVRTLHLPPPEAFLWQYVTSTPLGELVAAASDERRAAITRDVVDAWAPLTDEDGWTLEVKLLVATAARP